MSNQFKRHGHVSPPSSSAVDGDERNETDGDSGHAERTREKTSAFLQPLLASASASASAKTRVTPSCDDNVGDIGPSATGQSTLLLLPIRKNEEARSLQQQEAFVCTLPAKLVDGQRIRMAVERSTFDVTVNAAKVVTCQAPLTPDQNADSPSYAPSNQPNVFGMPVEAKNLCNEPESKLQPSERAQFALESEVAPIESSLPKLPKPQSGAFTNAVHYGGYRDMPHELDSHRSWPPPALTKSCHGTRSFTHASYNRKRARSMQAGTSLRQSKREISIARTMSPLEGVKNAANSDLKQDGPAIGSTRKATPSTIDGVNLEEIKRFAKLFKMKRLSLGLTQTQVGQTLSLTNGPAYSQSAICRFEKLDITPKSAQKIKPVLERWLQEVDDQIKVNGGIVNMHRTLLSPTRSDSKPNRDDSIAIPPQHQTSRSDCSSPEKPTSTRDAAVTTNESASPEMVILPVTIPNCPDMAASCKRRKRRTSFTPQALELLNEYFDQNSHPSGVEMTSLAERLNYEREVIRVWFCNKRQALKNTFKKLKTSP